MRYIRIKNHGVIEPEALTLLGASTKRGDSSKIGQFGSGNKFALAYLLRNNYDVKVWAGNDEIAISTKKKSFRDSDFEVITINGNETSLTTDAGKDWQFWQAIREVYCNAMDEGGYSMDFVQDISPNEGETHFYIENKKDAVDFITKFDNYFAVNKKVVFECPTGRIVERSGKTANVYRKGIRCFNSDLDSVYDYDFNEIEIDENRLVKYYWEVEKKVWSLIFQCDNEEVIKNALMNSNNSNMLEGSLSDWTSLASDKMSDTFIKTVRSMNLAPSAYAGLLKADEVHTHVIIPTKVFKSVRGVIGDENVGDKFKVEKRGVFFREVEPNELQSQILKEAKYFLKECGYEPGYEIQVCVFDDKRVNGSVYDDKILISDVCLASGVPKVVSVIIEENLHLKYGVSDETRAFQDAIIGEFVTYMKKINSFAI